MLAVLWLAVDLGCTIDPAWDSDVPFHAACQEEDSDLETVWELDVQGLVVRIELYKP